MVIAGPSGRRTVPAAEFFTDLFTTVIGEDELLVEVRVPKYTGWGAHYEKFSRTAQQWSIAGVAAAVRMDAGTIAEARVALTNMGSTPVRARAVEEALVGQPATDEAVRAAAASAADGTSPPSDRDGDADYRRHLAQVLTRRAVLAAAGA
jgi:carbon-monoxide dehydrogenase medium subunit